MIRMMFAMPVVALALIAAKPAPAPSAPALSMVAPAAVIADPANRWTLELSTAAAWSCNCGPISRPTMSIGSSC